MSVLSKQERNRRLDLQHRYYQLFTDLNRTWVTMKNMALLGRTLEDREQAEKQLLYQYIRKNAGFVQELGNLYRELIELGLIQENYYD